MKRRIIAALMCLCMLVGLLPMSAFAAGGEGNTYTDKNTAIEETGVTANKAVSGPDTDGNYTITLSVEGSTTTGSETKVYPADIVLVVDTSTRQTLYW